MVGISADAEFLLVAFKHTCFYITDNACSDAEYSGKCKANNNVVELTVIHYDSLNARKRNNGVVCGHGNIENSADLKQTDNRNNYRVHLAVSLNTLRAEEGEEKEEKVVYNRCADDHAVIVVSYVGGIDAYEIKNVTEDCEITQSAGKSVFCDILELSPAFITQGGPGCIAIQYVKM